MRYPDIRLNSFNAFNGRVQVSGYASDRGSNSTFEESVVIL
jgi:hypothetical protein